MTKCVNCKSRALKKRWVERTRSVANHVFAAKLPAEVCAVCATQYFSDPTVENFDLSIAFALLEAGANDAQALKFLRSVTGLQGKEFAALLGVRPETASRWEQGRGAIDHATYTVLRQLVAEKQQHQTNTADFLRSLKRPKRLPKRVNLPPRKAA